MQTCLKDLIDQELLGSTIKLIGKSMVNHFRCTLCNVEKDITDVLVLYVLLLQDAGVYILGFFVIINVLLCNCLISLFDVYLRV